MKTDLLKYRGYGCLLLQPNEKLHLKEPSSSRSAACRLGEIKASKPVIAKITRVQQRNKKQMQTRAK